MSGAIVGKQSRRHEVLDPGARHPVGARRREQDGRLAAGVAARNHAHRIVEHHSQIIDPANSPQVNLRKEVGQMQLLALQLLPEVTEAAFDHGLTSPIFGMVDTRAVYATRRHACTPVRTGAKWADANDAGNDGTTDLRSTLRPMPAGNPCLTTRSESGMFILHSPPGSTPCSQFPTGDHEHGRSQGAFSWPFGPYSCAPVAESRPTQPATEHPPHAQHRPPNKLNPIAKDDGHRRRGDLPSVSSTALAIRQYVYQSSVAAVPCFPERRSPTTHRRSDRVADTPPPHRRHGNKDR